MSNWTNIPNTTRIDVNATFPDLLKEVKGERTWKEFSRQIGIKDCTLQNYCYQRTRPDIKALKTIVSNTKLEKEDLNKTINWNKKLKLLSKEEPNLKTIEIKDDKIDLKEFCSGLKVIGESKNQFFPILTKEFSDNKIQIWYETNSGQPNPKKIKLTRNIKLNDELLEIFGLFQAEGTKLSNYLSFQFSNSNPYLIQKVLNFFKNNFNVDNKHWNCYITYWRDDFTKEKKNYLEEFWRNRLGISSINVREGTEYRLSENAAKYGVGSLRVEKKVFSTLIIKLLYRIIHPLVEKNKKYSIPYMRGLFKGDGVFSYSNGKINYIGLAYNPHAEELDHYDKIFKLWDLETKKDKLNKNNKRCIIFNHWKKHLKLLKVTGGRMFTEERNKNLIRCLLQNQYIKPLLRLKDLKEKQPFTVKNYAEEFNIVIRTARYCIERLKKMEFVSEERPKNKSKFTLTEKGLKFVNFIKNLEGV
ncbi:MAG: hypothetical protein ABEK36_00025 [Candidatus Aenigmatarchaeota archaeon]